FYITEPNGISVSYKIEPVCSEETGLFVDLNVSGGTAPYTFDWSNGETTEDIHVTEAGDYSVVVTDAKGCTWEESVAAYPELSEGFTCTISSPTVQPEEGSTGNILTASTTTQVTYSWSLISEDTAWTITSDANTAAITYNAGSANSTAIFELTGINAQGCSSTCSTTITSTPIPDNPDDTDNNDGDEGDGDEGDPDNGDGDNDGSDGEDPGTGDGDTGDGTDGEPGDGDDSGDGDGSDDGDGSGDGTDNGDGTGNGDGEDDSDNGDPDDGSEDNEEDEDGSDLNTCNDCFDTEVVRTTSGEGCLNYTMEVSHNGDCRFELSHFTVAVPCGNISNISNSEGWALELVHRDPTTGLAGFKVDDIRGFGKSASLKTFTVNFTVCASTED